MRHINLNKNSDLNVKIAKKSKKYVSCGRRTVFDYDDSGSIAYTPMEPAETSGDDTSDDSSDEDSVEEALQIKPSKENSAKGISKVKDTKVAAAAAASDSNKAQGGGSRKGQTYKRYH